MRGASEGEGVTTIVMERGGREMFNTYTPAWDIRDELPIHAKGHSSQDVGSTACYILEQ